MSPDGVSWTTPRVWVSGVQKFMRADTPRSNQGRQPSKRAF
ncbi:hypothetical protein D554_3237 [Bordetella holmesii 30539]|uniref:Uncharacterized protein n=2 Tax=Bordetella holmesii TaxID=35814 RepID=A0A158M1W6_9BORD|nr:hypothetical protein D560_3336 [Bordetella holmesii ATCC 51541]AIT27950.1 hypothetical protein D558_3309 [Bordetella holmesii 44057]EWM40727.1 hypothetical protein D555_3371 [Bordetella holmesii 35009]EWM43647.1 hypothetical protein D556_3304 [Bordetella holmesii 41130]EWM44622.1 hypothetical protein D557_2610 [Bordetella holmesii 70147]EXF87961.1 hypothetical protein D554_3237 [Bordetella holmesii 30539]EXX93961.1 hypothetical protein D559_1369 [Bordetella holmesii 1058]KAK81137.1 hypoth